MNPAAHPVQAYRSNELELSVLAASPIELVVMLYDGAIASITRARLFIEQGDRVGKAAQIARASDIVGELAAVLDPEQGELPRSLSAIYDYVRKQLLLANLHDRTGTLDEVLGLLSNLRGAWSELAERERQHGRSAGNRQRMARLVGVG